MAFASRPFDLARQRLPAGSGSSPYEPANHATPARAPPPSSSLPSPYSFASRAPNSRRREAVASRRPNTAQSPRPLLSIVGGALLHILHKLQYFDNAEISTSVLSIAPVIHTPPRGSLAPHLPPPASESHRKRSSQTSLPKCSSVAHASSHRPCRIP